MTHRIRVGNRVVIYRRGKKKTYVADFYDRGRHGRRSLRTCNLRVARDRAIKLENELISGELKPRVADIKLHEAVTRYIDSARTEGLRPKTIRKYQTLLNAFAEFAMRQSVLSLGQVTARVIDQFRADRKLRLSPKSMRNDGVTLKGFFKWCVQRHLVPTNPMAAMKFRKTVSAPRGGPSREQLATILSLACGDRVAQLALLAYTGCRSGELQRLLIEDVDLEGGWVHIVSRKGAETKTGESRKVPIHDALRAVLSRLPGSSGPCFFTAPPSKKYPDGGHWISPKHLNEDFLRLLKQAGLPAGRNGGFTVHSLRHTFETVCVNPNIPQRVVDTWLGHRSDRSMASVYYRLSDEESQRFMKLVPFGTGDPAADAGALT